MQPRIVDIVGTPMVNNVELTNSDIPHFLGTNDVITAESNEEVIVKIGIDSYWVIEQNTSGEVVKIESYYYYRRR